MNLILEWYTCITERFVEKERDREAAFLSWPSQAVLWKFSSFLFTFELYRTREATNEMVMNIEHWDQDSWNSISACPLAFNSRRWPPKYLNFWENNPSTRMPFPSIRGHGYRLNYLKEKFWVEIKTYQLIMKMGKHAFSIVVLSGGKITIRRWTQITSTFEDIAFNIPWSRLQCHSSPNKLIAQLRGFVSYASVIRAFPLYQSTGLGTVRICTNLVFLTPTQVQEQNSTSF